MPSRTLGHYIHRRIEIDISYLLTLLWIKNSIFGHEFEQLINAGPY